MSQEIKTTRDIIDSWPWRIRKAKLKQYQVAEQLNVSPAVLSRYINGDLSPKSTFIDAMEALLAEKGV